MKLAGFPLFLAGMWPLLAAGADYEQCAAIVSDAERLACYDQVAAEARLTTPAPVDPERVLAEEPRPDGAAVSWSILSKRWELNDPFKRGTFRFSEYKPVYILPVHYSGRPNPSPTSPAPEHAMLSPEPANRTEVKYQLSFKTKIWENIINNHGALWFAYTQQSHWLLYNSHVSSPFRETNYEPEVIFSLPMNVALPGLRWRMLNLGLVHQSNGRGLPLSRSWNRVYAQFGLERDNFALLLRSWIRIPDSNGNDDNPDISHFMGNGDVLINYSNGENVYSVLGRYSIDGGHGALQLSWGFPIVHMLKGYVQIFSGYGESLIDYNHDQTSIGLGLSLQDWH
jgi:phospholipase A1